jgi:hypothetical protein
MATMSDEQFHKAQLKARDGRMRFALWTLRDMRKKCVGRPRTCRLAKELRALKALAAPVGRPVEQPSRDRVLAAGMKTRPRSR